MTFLPPSSDAQPSDSLGRMGLWERIAGDVPMPDVRLLVATLAIALSSMTYSAAERFVGSDPVVQHDLATLVGMPVPDEVKGQLNGLRDVDHALQDSPMDWPAVEYRE